MDNQPLAYLKHFQFPPMSLRSAFRTSLVATAGMPPGAGLAHSRPLHCGDHTRSLPWWYQVQHQKMDKNGNFRRSRALWNRYARCRNIAYSLHVHAVGGQASPFKPLMIHCYFGVA